VRPAPVALVAPVAAVAPIAAAPAALAALVAALAAACSAGAPGPGVDADRAIGHVAALTALGPRPDGSPAAARAADYIAHALEELGATVERVPVGAVEIPALRVLGRTLRGPLTVVSRDPDLVVRLGGPGPALLFMAHYDTVPGSPGAVDNAAGVGALIELARALRAAPLRTPVVIAFPANEETHLAGSEILAARAAAAGDVAFALALDLVGGAGPLSLNGASRLIRARELRWLAGAADRAGVALRAPLPHRVVSRWWPELERSDHGPFTRRGIRAAHLYHRGQDGEHIDLAYHSARDTIARVERASVDELGRLLLALATEPVPPPGGVDGFWVPVLVDTVVPRWALIAAELALAALAFALLVRPARRGSPAARVGRGRHLGALAGLACYAAAAAAAVALERAAAGDHPAPWLHAPRAQEIALALVIAGTTALAARLAGRLAPWAGERRYLTIAIAAPLIFGLSLLLTGAAELAWIWLLPAAGIAAASRLGRVRWIALVAAALPAALLLDPDQLREAAWNRFLPSTVPLAMWIWITSLPVAASAAWLVRSRPPAGPLGTAVLSVGAALAILVGSVMLIRHAPPCSPSQFQEIHLACEAVTDVP
jgi:hypothetical protein